jgi:RNA recognition motif-containing protein
MLSSLPSSVDEQDLNNVLSSFGEVRAIHYQANASEEDADGNELASYLVEFFDIQDARQALLELEQTNPWGDSANVKVGTRSPTKRKQGKELIMLMSCWRQGVVAPKGEKSGQPQHQSQQQISHTATPSPPPAQPTQPAQPSQHQELQQQQDTTSSSQTARTSHVHPQNLQMQQQTEINQSNSMGSTPSTHSYYQQYPNQHHAAGQASHQQYQLMVTPDGQYTYVLTNHNPAHHHHPQLAGYPYGQMVIDPHQQQQQHHMMYASAMDQQYIMHNVAQQYHIQYNGGAIPNYGMPSVGQAVDADQSLPPTQFIRMSSNEVNSSSISSGSQSPGGSRMKASTRMPLPDKSTCSIGSGSSGGNNSGSGGNHADQDDNSNLSLNIDNVRTGKDRRSSLMVRNIPNKYTQQMLLAEFAAAGHGPTKIDFFYLPIDFKNKCNRGYAFINFVDFKDILPFFDEYNGTSWKRFNSDKICDITYARIQGKAAMLKRFENSALMEKDDEYRPKVFVSHGKNKGREEEVVGT